MNLHFQVICLFLKFCQLSEDENFIWGHDPQYSVVDTHRDYHVSKGPNGSYFVFTSNFEILPNILTPLTFSQMLIQATSTWVRTRYTHQCYGHGTVVENLTKCEILACTVHWEATYTTDMPAKKYLITWNPLELENVTSNERPFIVQCSKICQPVTGSLRDET